MEKRFKYEVYTKQELEASGKEWYSNALYTDDDITPHDCIVARLDEFGDDGWELAGINNNEYYFKRRIE